MCLKSFLGLVQNFVELVELESSGTLPWWAKVCLAACWQEKELQEAELSGPLRQRKRSQQVHEKQKHPAATIATVATVASSKPASQGPVTNNASTTSIVLVRSWWNQGQNGWCATWYQSINMQRPLKFKFSSRMKWSHVKPRTRAATCTSSCFAPGYTAAS